MSRRVLHIVPPGCWLPRVNEQIWEREGARKTCTVNDITGFFGDPHAVAGTCNTVGGDPNSMQMFANSYCKLGCAPGYRGVDSAYGLLHCRGGTGPYNRTGILRGGIRCELKSCVVGDLEQRFGPYVVPGTCGTTAPGTRNRRVPISPSDAVLCDFQSERDEGATGDNNSSAASFDYIEIDEAEACKKHDTCYLCVYVHVYVW